MTVGKATKPVTWHGGRFSISTYNVGTLETGHSQVERY